MTNILIHGLGQDEKSWEEIKNKLEIKNAQVKTPNLYKLLKNYQSNYKNLYKVFEDYCNNLKDNELNLCGLSLGGVLAIDYAIKYPQKVKSLILIGVPYKIPKVIFKIQNLIFKFMPKSIFENRGYPKKDFINLINSLSKLDIPNKVNKIKCKTLIRCGEQDKVNLKSLKQLNDNINQSEQRIIRNSKHEVNIENPIELSNEIIKFFDLK